MVWMFVSLYDLGEFLFVLVLIFLLVKLGFDDGVGGGGEEVVMVRVKRWLD